MKQNTVLIKKLNNNSFDLPKYQTEGSVGMDLSAFIENDILITESGPKDLMKGIPIEPQEIEDLMNLSHLQEH